MTASYAGPGSQPDPSISGVKEQVSDQFGKIADKATRTLYDAAAQAEDIASQAVDQARVVGGNMKEVAGNIQGAVGKSVEDQPMASLAMAAVLGFVLGAIWKS